MLPSVLPCQPKGPASAKLPLARPLPAHPCCKLVGVMRAKPVAILIAAALTLSFAIPSRGQLPGSGRTYNVRDFGASGKREDNATRAIQAAIDACTAAGGGIVYVPPADYTTGAIQLKDNVNLYLEAGATLYLSQDKADFGNRRAMIYSEGAKNIAVTGRGKLDGLAQYVWTDVRATDPEIVEEMEIARKAGVEMKRYYRTGMQTYMFILNDSVDVRLEGITVVNSPLWNVRLNNCDRVFIRGVYIYSDLEKGVNADGIDVVSSRNVLISDSVIVTADDAIVLKTIARNGRVEPVENVVVTNCVLSSSSTPLMIGTETEADIRHVVFSNSVIRNSNKGFGINVQDGAVVSDVIFSNLTVELNRRHWNWWGSAEVFKFILKKRRPDSRLGAIRDIVVDNVIAHARGTSTIIGHPDRPLENIRISNLQIFMRPEDAVDKRATDAIRVERVRGLEMRHVRVQWETEGAEPKWASAAVFRNVRDLVVDGFRGRQGLLVSPFPALLLEDVSDALIRESKAEPGCGTFLRVAGSGSANIRMRNNDLEQARLAVAFESENLRKAILKRTAGED